MEIEQYRTIEANLDLANDYVPTIRLNAGDVNGRILKFNVTDGGGDVDDLNGLSARLTWNRDPSDPSSSGGYRNMTARTNTDNATGVRQVTFTTPVPRALLQQAGERTVLGLDIEDAYSTTIASRSIPVIIEPSRLNPKAAGIADPLKDMHDTFAKAEELVGTVSTLTPAKKATSSLTGEGWKRKLNLGIPRGSKISRITAVALDSETPTVDTNADINGDMVVALGLPRGKQGIQGEPGPKGDPGDATNVPLASTSQAGVVRVGDGLSIDDVGTLSVVENQESGFSTEDTWEAFFVETRLCHRPSGVYLDALITLCPNPNHDENNGVSGFILHPLPPGYAFDAAGGATDFNFVAQTIDEVLEKDVTLRRMIVEVSPWDGENTVTIHFSYSPDSTLSNSATVVRRGICMPSFTFRIPGVRKQ